MRRLLTGWTATLLLVLLHGAASAQPAPPPDSAPPSSPAPPPDSAPPSSPALPPDSAPRTAPGVPNIEPIELPDSCRQTGGPACNPEYLRDHHWQELRIAPSRPPQPPPEPPPPPPSAPVSWTSTHSPMTWSVSVQAGPLFLATRDFSAAGFDLGVGFRHFMPFNPNPLSHSAGLGVATLGLSALPRGALLGNEMGLDWMSRVAWVSEKEPIVEHALRPVFRVQVRDWPVSLPSVLGTVLPAVGYSILSTGDAYPHAALKPRYEGLILRWSFGARYILGDNPLLVFVELSPFAQLLVPQGGSPAHGSFGLSLDMGATPMVK